MEENSYRIGIVGGMGPMAGVMLQKLIIEHTPATKDQDHLEVICFTNPNIPDRTKSLQNDNGKKFSCAIVESIRVLERVSVHSILIPCNTAHSRFDEIQFFTSIPIINAIDTVFEELKRLKINRIGLLATNGTIASKVFSGKSDIEIILPNSKEQKEIMDIIYRIKAGVYGDDNIASRVDFLVQKLLGKGAKAVILGCTELSLYVSLLKEKNIIDPLTLLAKKAVGMVLEHKNN